MGLTNYYSSYVENYAKLAALLTAKLRVSKEDGRKGSQLALLWTEEEIEAFENIKVALAKALSLHHIQVDKPFILRTDASAYAMGAVLEQERDGKLVPVCFCSRKLAKTQRNWAPGNNKRMPLLWRCVSGPVESTFSRSSCSRTISPLNIGLRSMLTPRRGRLPGGGVGMKL